MKTLRILFMSLLVVTTNSCKKSGCTDSNALNHSSEAKKDDGSCVFQSDLSNMDAKTFNFNLTFTSSDTYQSYSGITGYDAGDVVLVFVKYNEYGGTPYWVQTPFVLSGVINVFTEFSETTGNLFVNTEKADGSAGSPWSSTNTFDFKAVLIKSSGLIKHPDVDLTSYEEVKKTFKL